MTSILTPAAKERGILFSAPMVRAILDGKKTQTRRIVKPPIDKADAAWIKAALETKFLVSPYGVPGDRLWVRETHAIARESEEGDRGRVLYRADPMYDGMGPGDFGFPWRPSLFMPRWASRVTLAIVSVRVERLQGISEEDCISEGISTTLREHEACCALRDGYRQLWESINGKGSWDANPFCWVLEFKVLGKEVQ